MHVRYFPDTDTLALDFRNTRGQVAETIDGPDENLLLHFDVKGCLVGMTIEHASARTTLEEWRRQPQFEEVGSKVEA